MTTPRGAPLKIAMVAACPFPYPRGTPVRIYRMAEALAQRGHDVHVVTYHLGQSDGQPPFPIHRIGNVPTYTRLAPGPSYQKLAVVDPLLARKLRRVLRDHDIDVIHAHHFEGLLVGAWARRGLGVPMVFDVHTLLDSELHFYQLGMMKKLKKLVGRTLDRRLPRLADHMVTVTEDIRTRMVNELGIPADDVTAVVNGVECDHFAPPPDRPARRPDEPATLIFTGNLAAYQGVPLMLDALGRLAQRRSDWRLKIVSDSSFDAYEAQAAQLNIRERIEVTRGTFAELPGHLHAADIALNPRVECDGIPQKLLNYMAAGLPTVSFAGSSKVLRDGETGRVVPNGDLDAFAAAVGGLLDDPARARAMGGAARAFVAAECSWQRVAERCEDVYGRLFRRRRTPGKSPDAAEISQPAGPVDNPGMRARAPGASRATGEAVGPR